MPPPGAAHRFTVDRLQMIEAVKFAAAVCTGNSMSVRLEFDGKGVTVSAHSADVGETFADLTVEMQGGAMRVAFNPDYLRGALEVLTGETVTGEIADEMSPLRIGDGHTVHVLMPMRVS